MTDDPDGRVMVALVDVTKQLEMQDILIGVKRLISHKLMTPLNGLVAPLDMLAEGVDDEAERKTLVDTARDSATRLTETISKLERYFIIGGPSQDEQRTRHCELPQIVKQSASEFLIANLVYDGKVPDEASVPLGKQAMFGIVTEIFENAVKFHPRHRPAICINVSLRNDTLCLDITDDGCHVQPDALRHLHVPFYQAGAGLAGEVQGHGMGLAQVSRTLMCGGGRIKFANRTDGLGVCASIFLPICLPNDSKNWTNADIFAQRS